MALRPSKLNPYSIDESEPTKRNIRGEMQAMITVDELLVFLGLMEISGDKSCAHQELDHSLSRGEEA